MPKFRMYITYPVVQERVVTAATIEESRQVILDRDWSAHEMMGIPFADPNHGIYLISEEEIHE